MSRCEWHVHDGDSIAARRAARPGLGPAARDPHRRAHRAQLPVPLLGHRDDDAPLRHGRARPGARCSTRARRCPGLRAVQRAAVRAGGGFNHRDSLSDAVLIKDNHVAATGIAKSIERARSTWPGRHDRGRVRLARAGRRGARRRRRPRAARQHDARAGARSGRAARGRGRRSRCRAASRSRRSRAYAESGADFVSVGALTHSVPVFDIGLDMLWSVRSRPCC